LARRLVVRRSGTSVLSKQQAMSMVAMLATCRVERASEVHLIHPGRGARGGAQLGFD